jgi:hypothetical protein
VNLVLQRTSSNAECTQGTLTLEDGTAFQTLELPWIPNPAAPGGEPDVSCVPAGLYRLVTHDTPAHPKTFALVNPDLGVIHEPDPAYPSYRTACLIHIANRVRDLEGCIGVGTVAQYCVIWNSRTAMGNFQAAVPWESGNTLEIRDVPAP